MKKLICMLLTLQLMFSLAMPVWAAEDIAAHDEEQETQATSDTTDSTTMTSDPADPEDPMDTQSQECEHNWNEGSVVEATCTVDGEITSVCTLCNEIKTTAIPATGHSFTTLRQKDASGHTAVCGSCGAEESQGHTWDQGTVTKEPDCTESGEKTHSCPCGETKTETLPATGHNFSDWTKIGKNDEDARQADKKHRRTCTGCGITEYEDHAWKEEEVRKATCKETGLTRKTCTECGYVVENHTEKLKTHVYHNDCDTDCDVCGATRNVKHTYGNSWSRDSVGHWYECTKCGEQKDYAKHTPGSAATEEKDQVCTVCDYVIKEKVEHKHDYDKVWSTDKTGHWHSCKTCHDEIDFGIHVYDDKCDEICNVCNYVNLNAHDFGETWEFNDKRHWKQCKLCGLKEEEEKHIPGPEANEESAQTCTLCGYEIAPVVDHTHDFSSAWFKDEQNHWKVCDCSEKSVPMPHTWDEGVKGSKNRVVYTCTQCGQERMEVTESFPWWIPVLIIVMVLALGGAAVILFVLPKYQQGKFSKE